MKFKIKKTANEIVNKLLQMYAEEKINNPHLIMSRISPRRQGRIKALKWVLGELENI